MLSCPLYLIDALRRAIEEKRAEELHERKLRDQRNQLNNFFDAHKDEKWFKDKYHPDDSAKQKEKRIIALKKRLDVFKEFVANGKIDSVSVDSENAVTLVHLLDSIKIKLEGGTDFNLIVSNPTEKLTFEYEPEHKNRKHNVGENSNGPVNIDKKYCDESNKKDKSEVNKTNGTMDIDFEIPEISYVLRDRIRCVNEVSNQFLAARNDMKLCTNIINNFDSRSGLCQSIEGKHPAMDKTYSVAFRNTVQLNFTDFLNEQASAEKEEVLVESVPFQPEVNLQLLKALDRMLLYLRVVHSVDFYNYAEYTNEDYMPSRCYIMHVRNAPTLYPPTQPEITEYCQYSQTKANSLIVSTIEASEKQLIQLGARDEKIEIEKFITSNTLQLEENHWLCLLSGKKFKSPKLVSEHITNNYTHLLDAVKQNVRFFNNFLRDPNRPKQIPHSYPAASIKRLANISRPNQEQ